MNAAPALHLPACPKCSDLLNPRRPMWRLARLTSQKEGRKVYIWLGCRHAQLFSPIERMVREESEWRETEERWAKEAASLFAEVTARWSATAREDFRRAIEGRSSLPGATEPLPLEEARTQEDEGI
jgi:hypothetical protein